MRTGRHFARDQTTFRINLLPSLVATGLVVLLSANQAPASEPSQSKTRPNILFLFADDQRADTIAALGNTHIQTPNIDRLVHDGTAFSRAYCMGSHHGAVCIPSRAMLLTGRSLFHIKENIAGQSTWPEAFAKAGYTTFFTGKWHNQEASALRIFSQGKAIFLGGMGEPYKLPIQDISPEHTFVNPRESGSHSVAVFADAAIEFLGKQTGANPFLCYVPFNLPHDPRVAPQPFHDRLNANPPPLPGNFLPQHPFNNGALVLRDEELAPWPRTPQVVRQHLADYYAAIEFLDEQIGRILKALKASGQYENTLIVFTSDHGLALGSHGLFGKQSLYDHSMHSPLVIAGPGIPKGRRTDAFCYLLDLFPTLGDFAGVRGPQESEGLSLVPVLEGKVPTRRESIFTAYANSQRAVRDERWKLIVYPQINKTQLFDLRDDPNEMRDLAASPAHQAEVARLTALLQDSQHRLDDSLPLTSKNPQPADFDFSTVKSSPTKKTAGG